MAQITIPTDDFFLSSSWRCGLVGSSQNWQITYGPTTGSREVLFEWEPLGDVSIVSAKICAELGNPLTGAAIKSVNNVGFKSDGTAEVDIGNTDTSLTATFRFKANGSVYQDANLHESSMSFSKVYLLIEYIPNYTPPELVDYTDPNPVARETFVKAVHMTELHTNVNRVRSAYGLNEFVFTSIISRETGLGGWNTHVLEIRNALDETGVSHEDWIELGDNCPRVDILLQLRNVVAVVAAG